MDGIIEVFGISAITLCLFVLIRFLIKRYIYKKQPNKHALLEPIGVAAHERGWELKLRYRLPVAGRVELKTKVDGVPGDIILDKFHAAGYYSFSCMLEKPGKINQLCFRAPGTYLEKRLKLSE
ncbi:MAG: hypothetical protein ACPF8V_00290 [Luteibaculum sp.]